tara:strand:+ start:276 stop:587 length:312 start_codon:yes stop_codon:yes gene_type:complete
MKAIANIKELEGKTIKTASEVYLNECIVFFFTDESYAFFDVTHWGESYSICLNDNPTDYLKMEAGIITEEEYDEIKKDENKVCAEKTRSLELKQLEQLKAKYD